MSDDEGASLQGLIDFYKGSQAYNTILEMATSEMPAEDLKIILETGGFRRMKVNDLSEYTLITTGKISPA